MSTEIALNETLFKNALVSDIEFENGKETKMISIFNHKDLNFEEVKIGLDHTIKRLNELYNDHKGHNPNKIKYMKTYICSFSEGKLHIVGQYLKQEFKL